MISIVTGAITLSVLLAGCAGSTQGKGAASPEPVQETAGEGQEPADAVQTETSGLGETANQAVSGESIVTNGGEVISLSALEHQASDGEALVYYTSDISAQAMVDLYAALGTGLTGDKIAVKLSTGEPPASNYLDPGLIADLVHQVKGTIVESNMTVILCFPILRGMPWPVLEAPLKIYLSASALRREKH